MQPKLTVAEITAFLEEVFPQVKEDYVLEEVGPMQARVRLKVAERHLRPGGTVSGPSMFGLADCAFYMAALAMIGREALTVTTNCSINFMRKPDAADLICEAHIHKLGKTLCVGEARIFGATSAGGDQDLVAHATLTYAIPPRKG